MKAILARRFLYACLSLWLVATLTFFLMKEIPGDPFGQEQALPNEIRQILRAHYGLDDQLVTQYVRYLAQIPTFNFGPSLVHKGRLVSQIIFESLPISALLGLEALLFAVPLGLGCGVIAAIKKNQWQDSLLVILTILGISLPNFILATLLQYLFGIKLHFLPIARWNGILHSILPALSLAGMPIAFLARMTRTKMVEEFRQPYINTARAKGLSECRIIWTHLFRNIMAPILSYLGPLAASILTGSFIVEKIYGIPGLGYWFVTSVLNRDYPLIMGITIFYCALLLTVSLFIDLICLYLDPRITADQQRLEAR